MMLAISLAIVVLAIVIAHLGSLARQERQSQLSKRETPEPRFTYRHGREYYGDKHASRMKERAARRKAAALKEADGKVVALADRRRA